MKDRREKCQLSECINCEISWTEVQAIKELLKKKEKVAAAGLKDANGTEIYEGNIINFKGRRGRVVFQNGCFFVVFKNGDKDLLCNINTAAAIENSDNSIGTLYILTKDNECHYRKEWKEKLRLEIKDGLLSINDNFCWELKDIQTIHLDMEEVEYYDSQIKN